MESLEILKAARVLITNPAKWGQGELSKLNKDGDTCWCAVGALMHVSGARHTICTPRPHAFALQALGQAIGPDFKTRWSYMVPNWNDAPNRTHEQVLALFDKAIEIAERNKNVKD